ncbi:hypothetical protein XELAEV_18041981mg [Xenopus laevis]|uniref:CCHC-type domain-containing protein n=1 Tax=Xenopus laevis TaxID=8355 RepID=A0A974C3A0_XENLA|nr:hypothetical protein XELAEV_18041981mg [Xenopus laevis]
MGNAEGKQLPADQQKTRVIKYKSLSDVPKSAYVERTSGAFYVDPFVDNVAGWTEGMGDGSPFPREGSFSEHHINMLKGLCLGDTKAWDDYPHDPKWDMKYMPKCAKVWVQLAPLYSGPSAPPEKTLPRANNAQKGQPKPPPYAPLYPALQSQFTDEEAVLAAWRSVFSPHSDSDEAKVEEFDTSDEDDLSSKECKTTLNDSNKSQSRDTTEVISKLPKRVIKPPTKFQAPFMTVGDQMIIKPLDAASLNAILTNCPNPRRNPCAAVNYLKRMTKGCALTIEDVRLIIDASLGNDPNSGFDYDNVRSLRIPDVQLTAQDYPLRMQEALDTMWTEVLTELKRLYGDRKSLPIAMACKQKVGELVSDFIIRFRKNWQEEAGLNFAGDLGIVYVQTAMGGLLAHTQTVAKQIIDDWLTKDPRDFDNALISKDTAGCFDLPNTPPSKTLPKPHMQALHYSPPTNNGKGKPRYGRQSQNDRNQGQCFRCGKFGHWYRECRLRQPHEAAQAPAPPKYPIRWGEKTQ